MEPIGPHVVISKMILTVSHLVELQVRKLPVALPVLQVRKHPVARTARRHGGELPAGKQPEELITGKHPGVPRLPIDLTTLALMDGKHLVTLPIRQLTAEVLDPILKCLEVIKPNVII